MRIDEDEAKVWALCERFRACMLATLDGALIRARPLEPTCRREERKVLFLIGVEGHKDEEVARDPHVCLIFMDAERNDYVSLTGEACVRNDRVAIRELWRDGLKNWWEGPEDPRLRVLEVTPIDAQFWDRPPAPGGSHEIGKNRKVAMR